MCVCVLQAVAAEIEARYQAEEKATAEAQAQRVHEREVATAAAAALEQEAEVLKREAEASVAAWQRKRSLPALLGDLQVGGRPLKRALKIGRWPRKRIRLPSCLCVSGKLERIILFFV